MTTALLIGFVFGIVAGIFTARASERRDPIYGGTGAHVFHYITAAIFTASPVAVIGSLFAMEGVGFWGRLGTAVLIALTFLVISHIFALIFAMLERPARENALAEQVERGWTEQDARTSGL